LEGKEDVLDKSRQDLSFLKKELEGEEDLDYSKTIPPKLKKIYRKLLKINSPKDVKNLHLD
jgi:SepF-like predicted cell division protein (DUF552 family)